jgi:hypothetical protein
MNAIPCKRRCALLAAGALLAGLALARAGARPAPRAAPRPLPQEYLDLSVACLAFGEVRPPLPELSDGELNAMIELLGRLLHAYERRDFDSFLALRSGDLEFAARVQREHLDELRTFCTELGVDARRLSSDWVELLRAYWDAYYVEPPVARFLPEASAVALYRQGLGRHTLADWARHYEELCARRPGPSIRHRLMVPHRRSIERVAADAGDLCWLDVELGFEASEANGGGTGRLIARFVWDGRAEEWFLHRATTVLDGELRADRRHLVL